MTYSLQMDAILRKDINRAVDVLLKSVKYPVRHLNEIEAPRHKKQIILHKQIIMPPSPPEREEVVAIDPLNNDVSDSTPTNMSVRSLGGKRKLLALVQKVVDPFERDQRPRKRKTAPAADKSRPVDKKKNRIRSVQEIQVVEEAQEAEEAQELEEEKEHAQEEARELEDAQEVEEARKIEEAKEMQKAVEEVRLVNNMKGQMGFVQEIQELEGAQDVKEAKSSLEVSAGCTIGSRLRRVVRLLPKHAYIVDFS